ncbi:hypothetical protein Gorai_009414 [Gossypium raimondii]|uniref:Uncharacterized protein n=1 Tax=Gossypium raimondii TaxID=29730 RepID=A0A7J8PU88_GOSRA|nr:hypothetical protein [Gossypium raimondii]
MAVDHQNVTINTTRVMIL